MTLRNSADLSAIVSTAFEKIAGTKDLPSTEEGRGDNFTSLIKELYALARRHNPSLGELSNSELAVAQLAREMHQGQHRKSQPFNEGELRPYWHHLVQAWFFSLMVGESENVRAAALLHDAIEDYKGTDDPEIRIRSTLDEHPLLGTERIIELVTFVTDTKEEKDIDIKEEKTGYSEIKHVRQVSKLVKHDDAAAIRLKIYDRTANFSDWPEDPSIRTDKRTQYEANNSCEFFVLAMDKIDVTDKSSVEKKKIEELYSVFTHFATKAANKRNFAQKPDYTNQPPSLHGDGYFDARKRLERTYDAAIDAGLLTADEINR